MGIELRNAEINVNSVKKKQEKVKEKGSIRAALASNAGSVAVLPVGISALSGMQKIAKSLSPEQKKILNETADRLIKETKLADKGVNIADIKTAGINLTGMPDWMYEQINTYAAVANGKNAAFLEKDAKNLLTGEILHKKNTIIVNRDKLPTAIFHEMGHAFNNNSSKFWKAMQGLRVPSMVIASGLALFAAFTKKSEAEDGKELTTAQKTKNFVRDNAGILAAAAMLPVVAEESMASIRAAQWVKTNLPKNLAKKVNKSNLLGAITYVGTAVGLSLAAHIALKVKDHIMEKQKLKAQQKAVPNNDIKFKSAKA